jgi:hypothetical protein
MRPLLFMSYNRADVQLADRLESHLSSEGFKVWLDRKESLVGDDFVAGLEREIGRCDGLIFLLTERSAASSWCLAELQRALALRLPTYIVRREREVMFPDALERLLRDIQYLEWYSDAPPRLADDLRGARSRKLRKELRRYGVMVFALVALAAAAYFGVTNLNSWKASSDRAALLADLQGTSKAWSRAEIDSRLQRVPGDPELPLQLAALAGERTALPIVRFNAWQTLAAVSDANEPEWRFQVSELDWLNGRISNLMWANTAYPRGRIQGLVASQVRMAGLSFGSDPTRGTRDMSWIGVRIAEADIWFLLLNGIQLIDVEFENSKIRGSQLDLSGFAGVRFVSRDRVTATISTDVGIVEDSLIRQAFPLPGPGVLDLAEPEQEILFEGIQFHRVRFEGQFKPEWFRDNFFEDCTFASNLQQEKLEQRGNRLEGSVWLPPKELPLPSE